jgi:hypothetical protein
LSVLTMGLALLFFVPILQQWFLGIACMVVMIVSFFVWISYLLGWRFKR